MIKRFKYNIRVLYEGYTATEAIISSFLAVLTAIAFTCLITLVVIIDSELDKPIKEQRAINTMLIDKWNTWTNNKER